MCTTPSTQLRADKRLTTHKSDGTVIAGHMTSQLMSLKLPTTQFELTKPPGQKVKHLKDKEVQLPWFKSLTYHKLGDREFTPSYSLSHLCVSVTAEALTKLGYATEKWSQPHQKIYRKMHVKEHNQDVATVQSKSRRQTDWDAGVGPQESRAEINVCKPQ